MLKIEIEGIEDRIVRITPNSSRLGDAIISKDGESLYYFSAFEGSPDLWKMDLRKHETKLLSKGGSGNLQMDKDAEGILKVIEEYEGVLPFDDRVSPAIIQREFGLSKNAFKRAVGHLMKEGKVEIRDRRIYLL